VQHAKFYFIKAPLILLR